jgi:hypothetical protein
MRTCFRASPTGVPIVPGVKKSDALSHYGNLSPDIASLHILPCVCPCVFQTELSNMAGRIKRPDCSGPAPSFSPSIKARRRIFGATSRDPSAHRRATERLSRQAHARHQAHSAITVSPPKKVRVYRCRPRHKAADVVCVDAEAGNRDGVREAPPHRRS